MSFRQFGGLNYAAKHNIVASNYNTSNNLLVTQNVGQPHSYINFESDISGVLRVYGELDICGNLFVTGDVDISGNLNVSEDISAYTMHVLGPFSTYQDSTSVVPKSYIDTLATGVTPHEECICATTPTSGPNNDGTIILHGLQTIDGYAVQAGDRVLVKNQGYTGTNYQGNEYNGIWDASDNDWVLADDWSKGTVVYGASTFVRYGATNNRTTFIQLNKCLVDISLNVPPPTDPTSYSVFGIFGTYGAVPGRGLDYYPNTDILNVDTSLNFVNYLDSVAYSLGGPTGSTGTLNIGTNTSYDVNVGQAGKMVNFYSGITGPTGSFTSLLVSGTTILKGLITAPGGITASTGSFTNLSVSGTSALYGNVGIGKGPTGIYALDVSGNVNISKNETIGGTLGVTGSSSLYGNVGIGKGPTGIYALDVSGNVNISKNETIGGTLGVTGTSSMYGNVGIGKGATGTYALDVSGNIHIGPTGTAGTLNNGIYFPDGTFQNTAASILTPENFIVAGGAIGANPIAYSADGINWSSSTNSGAYLTSCNAVQFNGRLWVAGGTPVSSSGSPIIYSTDGITWTDLSSNSSSIYSTCTTIGWNGSVWIAGGTQATPNNAVGRIGYSYDGIHWFNSPSGTYALTSNNTLAISLACSSNLSLFGANIYTEVLIIHTTDGIDYSSYSYNNNTVIGAGFPNSFASIVYNGNIWLMSFSSFTNYYGNPSSPIIYSYDGFNWLSSNLKYGGYYGTVNKIYWTGSIWIAGGGKSQGGSTGESVYESIDGINWYLNSNASTIWGTLATAYTNNFCYNGNVLIASGLNSSNVNTTAYGYFSLPGTPANYITFTSNSSANSLFPQGMITSCSSIIPEYITNNWSSDLSGNYYTQHNIAINKTPSSSYALDVSGNVNISKNETIGGTLGVTGSSSLYGNVGIGKGPSSSYALDVLGNAHISNDLNVGGVVNSGNYVLYPTGQYPAYIKVGTFSAASFPYQVGQGIHFKFYFHNGYNAYNGQDYICELFFKLSNGDEKYISGNGAKANSFYYVYGGNIGNIANIGNNGTIINPPNPNPSPIWYATDSAQLTFDLYIYSPQYNNNSFYEVYYTDGCSWTNSNTPIYGLPSGGDASFNATEEYILDTPTTFNGNVGIGKGATGTYALDVSGNINVDGSYNYYMNGTSISDIYTQKYDLYFDTNIANPFSIKLGTFSIPGTQYGQRINIKIYNNQNINALNNEDLIIDIYLKLSNNSSQYSNFYGNSWYYMYSGGNYNNNQLPFPAWVQNSTNTEYTLYITTGINNDNSYYTVSYSQDCKWSNEPALYSYSSNTYPSGSYAATNAFYSLTPTAFTNTVTAPTPTTGDNSTNVATTAWVQLQNYASATGAGYAPTTNPAGGQHNYAPKDSPTFTGNVTVPNVTINSTTSTNPYAVNVTSLYSYISSVVGGYVQLTSNQSQTLAGPLIINNQYYNNYTGITVYGGISVANGGISVTSGTVSATTFNSGSDYRIKDNIMPLLEYCRVDDLKPVTYYNKQSKKQDIGLIAHEVQEVYPMLVTGEKDGETMQSINYLGLIPILIKEIQELKKEVKVLKTEIAELKDELKDEKI
jgi:hypothetical protein